ncbi:hypothetical protein KJI95_12785 [Shewanella sp. JM162201]|uniref:Porin n=1 Tax=Shewanella jiangmenensis TaxID=2837387 RepID=A0ABS5V6E9_9GAMM|nr:hypothetical protein [Shewanella jiangmenensis]MBT1445397.1 hypothetical protein [Shewanella jiangmenensis]
MKYSVSALLCALISLPTAAAEFSGGGFIKADAKLAHGTLAFKPILDGNPGGIAQRHTQTQFSAQESRFHLSINQGSNPDDSLRAYAEIDFAGSAQGNTYVSNSYSPRLRHAYLSYQGFTAGQTWSTLVNTASFPESANLGGALVGEAMVRQAQLRFTRGSWQFALENPAWLTRDYDETATPEADMALPDLIVKYSHDADWGNVSVAALARSLPIDGSQQAAFGTSLSGLLRINPQSELVWQLHYGHLGRYIGTSAAADVFNNQPELTRGGMLSLRHHLTESSRSNLYLGLIDTEAEQNRRGHLALNLFHDLRANLSIGIELGHYLVRDKANPYRSQAQGDSSYVQLSSILHF